jgi:SAM-dependent methyltransferase
MLAPRQPQIFLFFLFEKSGKEYKIMARKKSATSWDKVAHWYNGWVGEQGSEHHRELAIPALLELLEPQPGEQILDLGAGQGVLSPFIKRAGAHYTGVDASPKLLQYARRHHGKQGRFIEGDACRLRTTTALGAGEFDGVAFLLSLQDMHPLSGALESAAFTLKPAGRVVALLTHPCFRVPRQSGWGWDQERKLQFRRIDRYLTPLVVPMKSYKTGEGETGATRSFHRPLEEYINGLGECGLRVDRIRELATYLINNRGPGSKAENRANAEIPLFLGLRAIKVSG